MIAHNQEKLQRIREILLKDVDKKREKQHAQLDKELKEREEKILGEVGKQSEAAVAEAREEATRIRKLAVAQSRYKKDRELMKAREEKVTQMMGEIEQRLLAFRSEEGYAAFLEKLVIEAVEEMGDQQLQIHFNEEDTKLYQDKLQSRVQYHFQGYSLQVGDPLHDCKGGVIVENLQGTRRAENTLDSLLKDIQEKVGRELYKHLTKRS